MAVAPGRRPPPVVDHRGRDADQHRVGLRHHVRVGGEVEAAGLHRGLVGRFLDAGDHEVSTCEPRDALRVGHPDARLHLVTSVCEVLVRALVERVTTIEPANLAFGTRQSLLEVLEVLKGILGRPVKRVHGPVRPGDVPHSQANATRLQRLIPGLVPTEFQANLAATVAWFQADQVSPSR